MMRKTTLIAAKATTPAEQSDAIVVSFQPEWLEPLLAREFSVVIRKRVPKQRGFKWLYFHLNRPIGALYARAPIKRIFEARTNEAVALAGAIRLSPAEILSYIGAADEVGCYVLGGVQFATVAVSASQLATKMKYHAPQSFFILSMRAKATIDQLALFK